MSNADAAIAGDDMPRDAVDELIVRTRARGSVTITTGEIFSALPKLEPETDELKAIFERIQASGFEIIDEVIDDIRREFVTEKSCAPHCTVSCVHQISYIDHWRAPQTITPIPAPQEIDVDVRELVQIE